MISPNNVSSRHLSVEEVARQGNITDSLCRIQRVEAELLTIVRRRLKNPTAVIDHVPAIARDRAEHQGLRWRVEQIRAELYALYEKWRVA